ncbi:hypothetical protein H4R34_002999 [Dimargaris verticillata]|uniref:Uncharacterized protein n=1 Tax=Dimargaris verticillata TaxID=2761393 RepID=A0A9W8ED18_9FUNG|nr:hypothetical protein H4R34_002999 [Dimargaris verticillata]
MAPPRIRADLLDESDSLAGTARSNWTQLRAPLPRPSLDSLQQALDGPTGAGPPTTAPSVRTSDLGDDRTDSHSRYLHDDLDHLDTWSGASFSSQPPASLHTLSPPRSQHTLELSSADFFASQFETNPMPDFLQTPHDNPHFGASDGDFPTPISDLTPSAHTIPDSEKWVQPTPSSQFHPSQAFPKHLWRPVTTPRTAPQTVPYTLSPPRAGPPPAHLAYPDTDGLSEEIGTFSTTTRPQADRVSMLPSASSSPVPQQHPAANRMVGNLRQANTSNDSLGSLSQEPQITPQPQAATMTTIDSDMLPDSLRDYSKVDRSQPRHGRVHDTPDAANLQQQFDNLVRSKDAPSTEALLPSSEHQLAHWTSTPRTSRQANFTAMNQHVTEQGLRRPGSAYGLETDSSLPLDMDGSELSLSKDSELERIWEQEMNDTSFRRLGHRMSDTPASPQRGHSALPTLRLPAMQTPDLPPLKRAGQLGPWTRSPRSGASATPVASKPAVPHPLHKSHGLSSVSISSFSSSAVTAPEDHVDHRPDSARDHTPGARPSAIVTPTAVDRSIATSPYVTNQRQSEQSASQTSLSAFSQKLVESKASDASTNRRSGSKSNNQPQPLPAAVDSAVSLSSSDRSSTSPIHTEHAERQATGTPGLHSTTLAAQNLETTHLPPLASTKPPAEPCLTTPVTEFDQNHPHFSHTRIMQLRGASQGTPTVSSDAALPDRPSEPHLARATGNGLERWLASGANLNQTLSGTPLSAASSSFRLPEIYEVTHYATPQFQHRDGTYYLNNTPPAPNTASTIEPRAAMRRQPNPRPERYGADLGVASPLNKPNRVAAKTPPVPSGDAPGYPQHKPLTGVAHETQGDTIIRALITLQERIQLLEQDQYTKDQLIADLRQRLATLDLMPGHSASANSTDHRTVETQTSFVPTASVAPRVPLNAAKHSTGRGFQEEAFNDHEASHQTWYLPDQPLAAVTDRDLLHQLLDTTHQEKEAVVLTIQTLGQQMQALQDQLRNLQSQSPVSPPNLHRTPPNPGPTSTMATPSTTSSHSITPPTFPPVGSQRLVVKDQANSPHRPLSRRVHAEPPAETSETDAITAADRERILERLVREERRMRRGREPPLVRNDPPATSRSKSSRRKDRRSHRSTDPLASPYGADDLADALSRISLDSLDSSLVTADASFSSVQSDALATDHPGPQAKPPHSAIARPRSQRHRSRQATPIRLRGSRHRESELIHSIVSEHEAWRQSHRPPLTSTKTTSPSNAIKERVQNWQTLPRRVNRDHQEVPHDSGNGLAPNSSTLSPPLSLWVERVPSQGSTLSRLGAKTREMGTQVRPSLHANGQPREPVSGQTTDLPPKYAPFPDANEASVDINYPTSDKQPHAKVRLTPSRVAVGQAPTWTSRGAGAEFVPVHRPIQPPSSLSTEDSVTVLNHDSPRSPHRLKPLDPGHLATKDQALNYHGQGKPLHQPSVPHPLGCHHPTTQIAAHGLVHSPELSQTNHWTLGGTDPLAANLQRLLELLQAHPSTHCPLCGDGQAPAIKNQPTHDLEPDVPQWQSASDRRRPRSPKHAATGCPWADIRQLLLDLQSPPGVDLSPVHTFPSDASAVPVDCVSGPAATFSPIMLKRTMCHHMDRLLADMEQEFATLKHQYQSLVREYGHQDATATGAPLSSSQPWSRGPLLGKPRRDVGKQLKELISLMDVKSEQIAALQEIKHASERHAGHETSPKDHALPSFKGRSQARTASSSASPRTVRTGCEACKVQVSRPEPLVSGAKHGPNVNRGRGRPRARGRGAGSSLANGRSTSAATRPRPLSPVTGICHLPFDADPRPGRSTTQAKNYALLKGMQWIQQALES